MDLRIELSHYPGIDPWEWCVYDPRNVEGTLHRCTERYDSAAKALRAAELFMASRAADRFIR